jgi:hypothetical protein
LVRAFSKEKPDDVYERDEFFSSQIESSKLSYLGGDYLKYEIRHQWVSNTEYFIELRDMPEWSTAYGYVLDLTQPNSFKQVLSSLRWPIVVADNPPRLITLDSPSNSPDIGSDRPAHCTRSIYYFDTHSLKNHDYGALCVTEYGPVDGTGYYRHVLTNGKASLVRYNPNTKQQTELYQGEIERVFWVSSDEHYAVLGLDNSGKIDNRPGFEFDGTFAYMNVINPVIALVDLRKNTILFKVASDVGTLQNDSSGYSSTSEVKQLTSDILLIASITPNDQGTLPWHYTLVSLPSGKATKLNLHGDIAEQILPGGLLLDFPDGKNNSSALTLYDPFTEQMTPLMNAVNGYWAQIDKLDGKLLTLSVVVNTDCYSLSPYGVHPRTAQYVIQLP